MKVCKVKPSFSTCCSCIENNLRSCHICALTEDCEILKVGVGFLQNKVLVVMNGEIKKVPARKIFDIRDVNENLYNLEKALGVKMP